MVAYGWLLLKPLDLNPHCFLYMENVSGLFVLLISFADATHTYMFKFKSVHICIESVPYKVLSQLEQK